MGNTAGKTVGGVVTKQYPSIAKETVRKQVASILHERVPEPSSETSSSHSTPSTKSSPSTTTHQSLSTQAPVEISNEKNESLISSMNKLTIETRSQKPALAASSSSTGDLLHPVTSRKNLPLARNRVFDEENKRVAGKLTLEQALTIFQLRRGTLLEGSPTSEPATDFPAPKLNAVVYSPSNISNLTLPSDALNTEGSKTIVKTNNTSPTNSVSAVKTTNSTSSASANDTDDTLDPIDKQRLAQEYWTVERIAQRFSLSHQDTDNLIKYFNDPVLTETASGKFVGTWDYYPKHLRLKRNEQKQKSQ